MPYRGQQACSFAWENVGDKEYFITTDKWMGVAQIDETEVLAVPYGHILTFMTVTFRLLVMIIN